MTKRPFNVCGVSPVTIRYKLHCVSWGGVYVLRRCNYALGANDALHANKQIIGYTASTDYPIRDFLVSVRFITY